jgi:hypothetical protein
MYAPEARRRKTMDNKCKASEHRLPIPVGQSPSERSLKNIQQRRYLVGVEAVRDDGVVVDLAWVEVTGASSEAAKLEAKEITWHPGLDITCHSPRYRTIDLDAYPAMTLDPRSYAQRFIDAAPENAESVDEYEWHAVWLTREDLIETRLLDGFREHALNIGLVPQLSDLSRPVVITVGDGEVAPLAVWDGVHRIMSALLLGRSPIPAMLGLRVGTADNRMTARFASCVEQDAQAGGSSLNTLDADLAMDEDLIPF